jgi:hypothetical protein
MKLEPALLISFNGKHFLWTGETVMKELFESLRKAGVPE